jgi:hypothetical protein
MNKSLAYLVFIALLALVIQNAYQTFRIVDDQERIRARIAAQEASVQDAQKVRAQLLSIAGQTALLADDGNSNAQVLVERLKAQGVTITPPAR